MSSPKDAYSEGYAKGKESTVGGALAEITMGMMRDDPGGHFAAGYRDGAAGKTFKLPSGSLRKADSEINPFDDKAAIKTVCPNCREMDWFEWKVLGRLTDPVCGHSWYAGSGTYAVMQLRASFQLGRKFGKYMTSGKSKSSTSSSEDLIMLPVKGMFWLMGALMGIGCRLEFGILMIPIQAVVGLCQPKKTNEEVTARVIALAVTLGSLGLGLYELKHQPTPQSQSFQSAGFYRQNVNDSSAVPLQPATTLSRVPQPSFNCATAKTPTEKLICRDVDLAAMESGMAAEYRRVLQQRPTDQTVAFRRKHLEWFKQYSRACNAQMSDGERRGCVTSYLTARTQQLGNIRSR